jgi:hypothetical protein
MADYLPEPQFSYTKQLEAYDELLRKRKSEQKWGTIFNNIDALTNPNHVTSGYFARNEKRLASSYGTSLAQESKRLSLLGKAEKEGIHQEISKRLQDATKKYSMSSKSEFDAWFETLGPHFAGEYKKYFDEWNAGVKAVRAEEATIEKRARFDRFRFENDEKDAKTAADKLTAADIAFKDAEVDKLYLEHLPAYATYYNQVNMGMVSGPDNLTSLRMKIARSVANQDWTDDVKEAVITKVWATLNKSVTGGERIPTTSTALSVDKSLREQAAASTTRLQKTANKRVRTAYAAFVADKDNEPKNLEDYVNYHRQLSDQLDAVNYAGTYAKREDVKAVMDKFEQRYKGYESQRSKRYDPESVPTHKAVQVMKRDGSIAGLRLYKTDLQIQESEGTDEVFVPIQGAKSAGIEKWPKTYFIVGMSLLQSDEHDSDTKKKIWDYLQMAEQEGVVNQLTADQAFAANLIQTEVDKIGEKGMVDLAARLNAYMNRGAETPTDVSAPAASTNADKATAMAQELRNMGVSVEEIRRILINKGLIDG